MSCSVLYRLEGVCDSTSLVQAVQRESSTLKNFLKSNLIPKDILDALKNTKAIYLSILCLLDFQFEQAYGMPRDIAAI